MAVQYIGDEPGRVRIGTRPILPGDCIAGPPDVVAALLGRADFKEADAKPKRAKPAKPKDEEI